MAKINVELNLDFKLLKDQKLTMLYWLEQLEKEPKKNQNKIDLLNGMIGLLNEIQDQAVDKCGVPENTVFFTPAYATRWKKKQTWIK